MVIPLDERHENAIRWSFEKENARWIVEVLKNAQEGKTGGTDTPNNIYSQFLNYRDTVLDSTTKLASLTVNYNIAKDKHMARAALKAAEAVGLHYDKLQPSYLRRD